MNTCKSCAYYSPNDEEWIAPFGSCSRWEYSYRTRPRDMALNEIVVETDEGWGAYMGPDFGCVLWEKAEDGN